MASTSCAFFMVEVPLMPLDFASSRNTLADKLSYFSLMPYSLSYFIYDKLFVFISNPMGNLSEMT